jgi:hypothetical protein
MTRSSSVCVSSRAARPRYCVYTPGVRDHADEVNALMSFTGKRMMPWQMDDLRLMTAETEDGLWANNEVGKSIPRQAGKTTDVMWWAVDLAMVLGYRVLWTAHNYDTTCKTIEEFRDILGSKPHDELRGISEFNSHVLRASSKTSQEMFEFKPFKRGVLGGCIVFSTRTRTSKLGSTFDVVIMDEAQEATQEHLQALLPTTSSGRMKNPQFIYMGTPRRAGSTADVFDSMRNDLISDNPPSGSMWLEYGLEEIGDVDDESRWYEANPSLSQGVADITAIRAMRKRMTSVAFAQECLGVWLSPLELAGGAGAPVIGQEDWEACASSEEPPTDPRAYAVKFAPDGSTFAVAVAVTDGDIVHVELVDHRTAVGGKRALAEFVSARAQDYPVVIDGKAGADSLIERLVDVPEVNIIRPGTAGVVSACSGLLDAISEGRLRWFRPQGSEEEDELTRCMTSARRRRIGRDGGWGFEGDGADAAEAAALAVWQAQLADESEPMEVWF